MAQAQFQVPQVSEGGAPPNPHFQAANYGNPITALFCVIFKGSAIAFYIFCGWITSSFIIHFVVVTILMALDFWTVKNVSGRILVGLRWWNEIDEQGISIWRFESLDQQSMSRINQNDSWLFWTSLYVTPAIWTVFGIVSLLKFSFDYLLLVCISLTLCSANIIGFTKCRKDAKKQVENFARHAVAEGMREAMTGGLAKGLQKTLGL
ncbi:golgi apparatus membrane protein TVP23 [Marchantia polymorpha subsp. ruderalis]|uniref:Golgi apparatus membrane protein TVP23 n=2 Tax=Marchantia polymorpha TaxID=3197 RepID=A0AAF6BNZ4_MARPO|nr:hypothetical protein MARPO_0097s0058 [Marchantia polymorpha]BBN13728.1 hypothetical protein Mp_6g05850 [Marchantia polymorpha subsp. ruderalis]|eukprot:PTQ32583.1 hypothetical protein MARPO_0097s0058 [Marchantia polymorpha]